MRALLFAAALALTSLAGCVTPSTSLDANAALDLGKILAAPESIFPDHQNEPHPAFGWPTLTHPAVAEGVPIPEWWAPIPHAELPATIKGLELASPSPEGVPSGGGIALFGRLAFVPGYDGNNHVVDISDPLAPKKLGSYEGGGRGAAIMATPAGKLFAVVAKGGAGFDVVDITDPTKPEIVSETKGAASAHKLGLVPGTPLVYIAHSNGGRTQAAMLDASRGEGFTEIYDLTDPAKPELVQTFKNGFGCHHIYFWIDASQEKHRATCAGIEYTQIWDIADPKAPQVIVTSPFPHGAVGTPSAKPPMTLSHFAILNEDGTILIVGDEFMGGGAAECDGLPQAGVSGPLGNVWFYDVKNEKDPKLLGWISPPPQYVTDPSVPEPSTDPFELLFGSVAGCTAHHGRLVPDPEGKRELLVMAWYGAGVVLIDFTDPASPWMVDEWNPGTNTWEAWYYNGYVFTGDLARGFDVLTFK